jgi:hypothetical protein
MWLISDTCNTVLKLCVKLNSRINGVLAHQAALPPTAASIHVHINSGLLAASCEYNTGDFPWHQVNATPLPLVDVDTRHVDTLLPFASSEMFPFVDFPTPRHEF